MAEQKAHKPTKKRLEQARREGNVLKSKGISAALVVLGGVVMVYPGISFLWIRNKILLEYLLIEHSPALAEIVQHAVKVIFLGTLLTLVPASLSGLLGEVCQVGVRVEWKLIAAKMDRLNPVAGVKRLFSNLKGLLPSCIKIAFLLLAIAFCVYRAILINSDIPGGVNVILHEGSSLIKQVLLTGVLILFVFGIFEYLAHRRRFLNQLSMSDEEIRREFKEMEGDPFIRSARRSLHQEIAMRDLEKRVRSAKVVVVERN